MDLNFKKYFCDKHRNRNAIGICLAGDCTSRNLCPQCISSHEGSHNNRILFLDENIFKEDSLFTKTKEDQEKYLKFLDPIIKNKKNYFEEAKEEIGKAFDNILDEFTKCLNKQKEKIFFDLKKKFKNIDEEKIGEHFNSLKEVKIEENNNLDEIIEKLQTCTEVIFPKIDKLLAKRNFRALDAIKSLENESISITLNQGLINKVVYDITDIVKKISVNHLAKIEGNQTFTYSGIDYDNEGLFYWFGTEKGLKEWHNPCNGPYLTVKASKVDYGTLEVLTANKLGSFFTGNDINAWVTFTLLEGLKLNLTFYTMSFDDSKYKNGLPRFWNLEGSNDGANWDIIQKYDNDQTFSYDHRTHTFAVDCHEYYSIYKIQQTGADSNGRYYLTVSGLEFYGTISTD